MTTAKRVPNPTKADIVRIILARHLANAETRLGGFQAKNTGSPADVANLARLNGEVSALTTLQRKVIDYLDHGKLPLE